MNSADAALDWFICWYCRTCFLGAQELEDHNLNHHGKENNCPTSVINICNFDSHLNSKAEEVSDKNIGSSDSRPCSSARDEGDIESVLTDYNIKVLSDGFETKESASSDVPDGGSRPSDEQHIDEESSTQASLQTSNLSENLAGADELQSEDATSNQDCQATEKKLQTIQSNSKTQKEKRNVRMPQSTKMLRCYYSCDICGKRYKSKQSVEQHMLLHTDERPFLCHYCGLTFRQEYHLQRHLRARVCSMENERDLGLSNTSVAEVEKPFYCETCGKSFKNRNKLKYHSWLHTGQKLFKCKVCGNTFANPFNMQRHLLSLHGQV